VFLWILPTLFSSLPTKVGSFINFTGFSFVLRLTATLAFDCMLFSSVKMALEPTYQGGWLSPLPLSAPNHYLSRHLPAETN
jgi:hypothetical protein